MRRLALLLGLLALPAVAGATAFRFPLDDCDQPTKCLDSNKCYVTAYYDHSGKDWNCSTVTYSGHVGSDYGVKGTYGVRPIVAGAAGTVTEKNDGCAVGKWGDTCGGGFGNFVKLRHADGKVTIYGHMQSGTPAVNVGDKVNCGQLLGKAGSSGNSTGPHLHFEVVDPTYGSDDPYSGSCGGPLSYWVGQGAYCKLPETTCEGSCTKQCGGKSCGPDGCGGSCGSCAANQSCTNGQCVSSGTSDDAEFVSETIADGTHFAAGAKFTKTWTLENTGTSTWTKAGGYALTFIRDQDFDAPKQTWPAATESVSPGGKKTWTVAMTAPQATGSYNGYWRMMRNGVAFGDEIWVSIVVDPPAATVDKAEFVSETIPDDTHFKAGESFTKTWTIKNTGTSTWTRAGGYQWKFSRGDAMGPTTLVELGASETLGPGATKTWSIPMTAPTAPGTYRGYWAITHNGTAFAGEVWVEIIVDPNSGDDKDNDGHASKASGGDDCDDDDRDVYKGAPELCDKKDNDCDGKPEGAITRSCSTPCKGTEYCVDGQWKNCDAPEATDEKCNGVDDDCDGLTDYNAVCGAWLACQSGTCVEIPREPDAGAAGLDAGPAGRDGGVDGGTDGRFQGGGCGCGATGPAPLWGAALLLTLLWRRKVG